MSRLKQRAVIHYPTLKNLKIAGIATEGQNVNGTDTLKYSTISQWTPPFQVGSDDPFDLTRSGGPFRSGLAAPIQSLLQQFPFISCEVLCRKLGSAR
jgi:hypothetical protein